MRVGGMPALARHGDVDVIGRRHRGPGPDREFADRQARPIVHPVHFLNAPAGHHAVGHHLAPTAAAFFGRLKDHHCGAVKIARLGQVFRRP